MSETVKGQGKEVRKSGGGNGWVMPKKSESMVVIQVLGGRLEIDASEEKSSIEMMNAESRRGGGSYDF